MRVKVKLSSNDWETESELVIKCKHEVLQVDRNVISIDNDITLTFDEEIVVCAEEIDSLLANVLLTLNTQIGTNSPWEYINSLYSKCTPVSFEGLLHTAGLDTESTNTLCDNAHISDIKDATALDAARVAQLRLTKAAWQVLHPEE